MEFLIAGIGIIFAIVFFVMAYNISKIKDAIRYQEERKHEIDFQIALHKGDMDAAHQSLLKIFYARLLVREDRIRKKETYRELQERYKNTFNELGKPFPEYPSN